MKKLKELRESRGLSQVEVAKKLNLNNVTYGRYEASARQPDIETLCKIADFYGVSLDHLCDHKTKNQLDYGQIDDAHFVAHNILQALPDNKFFEFFGRLQNTADMLGIKY